MIISRSQKFALLFLLLLALFITACGGGAAPAETEEADATEAVENTPRPTREPTTVPTEMVAASDSSAVADTFPCNAQVIAGDGKLMRNLMRQPSATAPLVGARRGNDQLVLGEVVTNDEGNWYGILENRLTIGYIAQEYIILGEACVSGGGAEATEEATAEATEE
jgi:hypothetical protein